MAKCGNCGNHHESAELVRSCYGGVVTQARERMHRASEIGHADGVFAASEDLDRAVGAMRATGVPATEKQLNFISILRAERGIKDPMPDNISKTQATEMIQELKEMPAKNVPSRSSAVESIPEGRYAVEHEGALKFYKIDKPTEGRWAGYTFLKVMASDEEHPVKNREYREEIFTLIAQDPEEALKRYGREIGRCGICGRTLTDEDSRALGIGPICADRRS